MPGKITVKQSGNCVIGLSHVKLGWKSCIFCSLTPLIAANAAILLAPPPPVTAGRRASGKKTPGANLSLQNLYNTNPCCHGNENLRFSTHTDGRYDIIGS